MKSIARTIHACIIDFYFFFYHLFIYSVKRLNKILSCQFERRNVTYKYIYIYTFKKKEIYLRLIILRLKKLKRKDKLVNKFELVLDSNRLKAP